MAQPDVPRLARALRELVSVVARETASHQLSRTAAGTLSALERHGPSRISTLTRLEAVGQPAMTGLVQRLEASGLVSRASDPDDRRATLVAVTDAGRAALAGRRRSQDAIVAARLARLAPHQLATLEAAVDAIVALTQEDHVRPH